MYIYRNNARFFVSSLEKYLPAGAIVARYENATKLTIVESPRSDVDPFNTLVDGFELDDPALVTWIYEIEPPPLGTNTTFFTVTGQEDEDNFGNVGSGGGLPAYSKLKIARPSGVPHIQNDGTGLWHPLRIVGPDGNVYLEIGQNGVPEGSI